MKASVFVLSVLVSFAANATLFRVRCDQPDARYRISRIQRS